MLSPVIEETQNGVDSAVNEDSDSLGNSKSSKASITPPTAKEKRKPFFKKVDCVCVFFLSVITVTQLLLL